jgi:hypothetical protein
MYVFHQWFSLLETEEEHTNGVGVTVYGNLEAFDFLPPQNG